MSTNIQVAVRVRPFLPFEAGSKSCIDVLPGDDENDVGGGGGDDGRSRRRQESSSSTHGHGGRSVRIVGGSREHEFTFDRCYSGRATQVEIYDELVSPLLKSCLEGYNATTLAYGQTGSGKTYTTLGPATSNDFFSPNNNGRHTPEYDAVGILPRALRDLFDHLERKKRESSLDDGGEDDDDRDDDPPSATAANDDDGGCGGDDSGADGGDVTINGTGRQGGGKGNGDAENGSIGIPTTKSPKQQRTRGKNDGAGGGGKPPFEYQVRLQFLELYGEDVRDLLATTGESSSRRPDKIVIRDGAGDDAEALGAASVPVATAQEAMVVLTRGMLRRVTGATAMNAESSRSHALMSVRVRQVTRTVDDDGGDGNMAEVIRTSKYNFVDLAGSERSKRTNAKGQRMREGININKGLLVLGNVISALAGGDKFVPFRDSKLTRLLRGSLGGNHRTLMIACASPSHRNAEESLNCLRYANRAKNIRNRATVNVDPHSRLVSALRGQVTALAGELLRLSNRGGGKVDGRFTTELLEALVKGGKDAQSIQIASKAKPAGGASLETARSSDSTNSVMELTAELEKTRSSLKETERDLLDKSEQLTAVLAERDSLRRDSALSTNATPRKFATPSRAIGAGRDQSIQDIVTGLSAIDDASDTLSEGTERMMENGTSAAATPLRTAPSDVQAQRIDELTAEVETLRASLDRLTQVLEGKTDELNLATEENEALREAIRNTPDIDEETIHYIVKNITSYDEQRMDEFQSEMDEDEGSLSDKSSLSADSVEENKQRENEPKEAFASAMFCTGKFLVDGEMFEDSIACFETVLEVRREVYGWDDPSVGDALHMEGFVRSKMGDYDRALMLLWDALRIRKIAEEPLKISATLRLLADLHFSKEENMHAALFYEECARHLKDHNLHDPHLPLVLIDLARTKDRLGDYTESMNFFEEALSLYEHSLCNDDDRVASLQYEMGVLAFQMGDRLRGEECFQQFIRIRKSKGNNMDEGVANALFVLGSLHWATKKRDLAQTCWHEALEIFTGLGRTDDDAYVKSLKEKIQRAQRRPISRIFRGS